MSQSISVLLVKQSDLFSKVIYFLTGRKYTHASIRLDNMSENFFSFDFRGMCIEEPGRLARRKMQRSTLFQIEVPDDAYAQIKVRVEAFLEHRKRYRYSRLGLCLCLLRIPHKFQTAYFCSQFVAELLEEAGVVHLGHSTSLCLPNTLERVLQTCGALLQTIQNPTFA